MLEEITVETVINNPIKRIWDFWTMPEHITKWAFASNDWCVPHAEVDLHVGGRFKIRMEAKDGSAGFDFSGTYTAVQTHKLLKYTLDDGRKVSVEFLSAQGEWLISETFEAETENPIEMQRAGWQAMLDNFKKYVTGR